MLLSWAQLFAPRFTSMATSTGPCVAWPGWGARDSARCAPIWRETAFALRSPAVTPGAVSRPSMCPPRQLPSRLRWFVWRLRRNDRTESRIGSAPQTGCPPSAQRPSDPSRRQYLGGLGLAESRASFRRSCLVRRGRPGSIRYLSGYPVRICSGFLEPARHCRCTLTARGEGSLAPDHGAAGAHLLD